MSRLSGRVAVVTGGASGIGYAIAAAFAAEGARVCIADLSQERCESAAAAIGSQAVGRAVDVSDPASVAALYDGLGDNFGTPDILVNSAGVFGMGMLPDISGAEFDRIFGVNAKGVLFMTQAAATHMIAANKRGAIVNIASGAGRRGIAGATLYAASKAAVISITQSTANELIPHGIRVNAIAPGSVKTPMWQQVDQIFADVLGLEPGAAESANVALTPAGRMSTPDDYVGAALFLASTESDFVVGQTLNVDGGMFMS